MHKKLTLSMHHACVMHMYCHLQYMMNVGILSHYLNGDLSMHGYPDEPLLHRNKYTPENVNLFLRAMEHSTSGLKGICRKLKEEHPDFPAYQTVDLWRDAHPEFAKKYDLSKMRQIENLIDEIVDIADDATNDEIFTDEGKRLVNAEAIARSKLRVNTRQWLASKLLARYKDKTIDESGVSNADLLRELG